MSKNVPENLEKLTPLQRAAFALKEMRSKLDSLEQAKSEPIAIVGMGCRFPGGANNPESFWELLRNGRDGIVDIPNNRWDVDAYYDSDPEKSGKMNVKQGGFLDKIDEFDGDFFGLTPRELINMDPQQRLLLEVSWEALENATINPQKLMGSKTGVFIGISVNEYAQQLMLGNPEEIDVYMATGNALSVTAGRLSYYLGLQGPSLAVDTACSSSLVSIHLAVQSLRNQECRLALAGGVYLMVSPLTIIAMSKLRALSPDGRCKTFDAAADGYGRGEGCGMIVLKRLSDAVADGDDILALIRGSAVNQDGRSSGLTVPNGQAQQACIREALQNAKVNPSQISYVEAHGTGTSLGDPIEVKALAEVLGKKKVKEEFVSMGSVKTNIGHLEAAAGIAGLIKVVLAMQHQEIPPHLNLKEINPLIFLEEFSLKIPTKSIPWEVKSEQKRFAGVSSFGFSGTNSHIILEEFNNKLPNKDKKEELIPRPCHLLTLSAKSKSALDNLITCYKDFLEKNPQVSIEDICFTANTTRPHFNYRWAVVGENSQEIGIKLNNYISDLKEEKHINYSKKIAFIFTGQGSQYFNMGKELYETQPLFRQTLKQCDDLLRPYLEKPLLEVLYPEKDEDTNVVNLIDETAYTQPALFAVEYALAKLWQSWGIQPDGVMGHSVGEYVAACVAGVFSLEDGLKLISHRGRLMNTLPRKGKMVAVFTTLEKIQEKLASNPSWNVAIAAINGPNNIVISGESSSIKTIISQLEIEEIEFRELNVSHAFHSDLMKPMVAEFAKIAGEISYFPPKIDLIANETGEVITHSEITNPQYWCRHICQPVRFFSSIQTLEKQSYNIFLEIGPNPILIGMARRCFSEEKNTVTWLPSLKKGEKDWQILLESLGKIYTKGIDINWLEFDSNYNRNRVRIPNYPWNRQKYWNQNVFAQNLEIKTFKKISHPLLDRKIFSPLKQIQFESELNLESLPLVKDHQIDKMPIMNLVVYLEIAFAGIKEALEIEKFQVKQLFISQALSFLERDKITIQLILTPENQEEISFQIFSQELTDSKVEWILHASGKIIQENSIKDSITSDDLASFEQIKNEYKSEISADNFYQMVKKRGVNLGNSCQCLEKIWHKDGESIGIIKRNVEIERKYLLPLGAIDAWIQLLSIHFLESTKIYLIVGLESFQYYGFSKENLDELTSENNQTLKSNQLWGRVKLKHQKNNENNKENYPETILANLWLFDNTGKLVAEIIDAHLKPVSFETLRQTTNGKSPEKGLKTFASTKISISKEDILNTPAEKRLEMVEQYIIEGLANSLQILPNKIQSQQLLTTILDSLMAMELKNRIETDLKLSVPVSKFFEEQTITQLASDLLTQLALEKASLLEHQSNTVENDMEEFTL